MKKYSLSQEIDQICFKCGKAIAGNRYTVVAQGEKLVIRRALSKRRPMHEGCAIAWADAVRCTPERAKEIPAITKAMSQLELIEDEAKRYLDAFSKEIECRRKRIFDEVVSYHRTRTKEICIDSQPNLRESSWSQHCVLVLRNIADKSEELRPIITAATSRLKCIESQIDWIVESAKTAPPDHGNPVGLNWNAKDNLESICGDASAIMDYLNDLSRRSKSIDTDARSEIDFYHLKGRKKGITQRVSLATNRQMYIIHGGRSSR